jgi:hypothetical protein
MIQGFTPKLQRDGLSKKRFIDAYTIDNIIIGSSDLDFVEIIFNSVAKNLLTSRDDKSYHVTVKNKNNTDWCVYCIRSLLYNRQLISSYLSRGKVCYRDYLNVSPNYENRGIATTLLQQEESLIFRKWSAIEIQATVALKGAKVWTLPQFGYEIWPEYMSILKLKYLVDWQIGEKPLSEINSMKDFPSDFWDFVLAEQIPFCIYKKL